MGEQDTTRDAAADGASPADVATATSPETTSPETAAETTAAETTAAETTGAEASDAVGVTEAPEASAAKASDAATEVIEGEVVELPVAPPSELDVTRQRLSDTEARLRAVSKAYNDLQQEMEAFRRRMEVRTEVMLERQSFDVVRAFFEPVQNLQRSLKQPVGDTDGFVQGLRMVSHQFDESLKKLGLEPVPGEGSPFDPNLHEALAVTPVTDIAQDGRVLMVHQAGFAVKGKVIQAAQVVIGKFEEPSAEA